MGFSPKLLNINFWFGLKPVFFRLHFKHDINVVANDVHKINIESMRNISNYLKPSHPEAFEG